MRHVFLDTYWLPVRIVGRLKWWLLVFTLLVASIVTAFALGSHYLGFSLSVLMGITLILFQRKIIIIILDDNGFHKNDTPFNIDFVWYLFIILTLPNFISYTVLQIPNLWSTTRQTNSRHGLMSPTGDWIDNLPVFLTVYLTAGLCLTFFGTSLPATVTELGQGLTAAMKRGWRGFRWLFPRLLAGPALFLALPMLFPMFKANGALTELLHGTLRSYSPKAPWVGLLDAALIGIATVQVHVLLAMAYRRDPLGTKIGEAREQKAATGGPEHEDRQSSGPMA